MKRKTSKLRIVLSYIGFFFVIAVTVTAAVLIFDAVRNLNRNTVAFIMLAVVIALALICTFVYYIFRRLTVKAPVDRILSATEAIAAGDFSVRLEIGHRLNDYDEYDYIAENLNKMAAELSRNEVLKTDFISNVSHELKTPLAIIQNYATLLKNEKLSPEQRGEYAGTLVAAAKRLTDLIVNILKLNKLENQEIKPEYEKVRLDEMLAQSVIGFEDIIEKKGLALDCDLSETTIVTSPSYLEIVWNNLLSNAVKFTPEGGFVALKLSEDDGFATVEVRDTGCGISPETGSHIFDKFYQGDTSHAQEGNGLGLALVKKVIDVLGGEISVESQIGKGTTFTVRLKKEL